MKRYYKISEVARECGVFASAIDHWQKSIPAIKPKKKNILGHGRYTEHEKDRIARVAFVIGKGANLRLVVSAFEKGYFSELYNIIENYES